MKLRFNRQEMADALRAACSIVAARTPKPVLRCVRLEASSDVLLVSTTDLELGLRYAVTQVEVEGPGETLVVADTLSRIVSECTDEVLDMETTGSMLHIRGVGSHFQVVTHDPAEFPPVPTMEGNPQFTIDQALLVRLVEWTVFASARESTRYAINGVLWEVEGGKLLLAATDGRRLSMARGVLKSGEKSAKGQAIVPGKALHLLARLPAHDDAQVGVQITSNQLLLSVAGAQISSSLVEGHFPKYQDVVPSDCDRVAEVNSSEFHGALKRVALLTSEESKGIRLSFQEDVLTLSSRAPEQGEATISMPVRYRGEPLEIGFNPVFLTDVLRVVQAEEIRLEFKEQNRPGVVRDGDDFCYVVMPVNLTSA